MGEGSKPALPGLATSYSIGTHGYFQYLRNNSIMSLEAQSSSKAESYESLSGEEKEFADFILARNSRVDSLASLIHPNAVKDGKISQAEHDAIKDSVTEMNKLGYDKFDTLGDRRFEIESLAIKKHLESSNGSNTLEGSNELSETEKQTAIENSTSFDDLFTTIDRIGSIQGSDSQPYLAEELKDKIARVRSGTLELKFITRTNGLRDKVTQLLKPREIVEAPVSAENPQPLEDEQKLTEVQARLGINKPSSETGEIVGKEGFSIESPSEAQIEFTPEQIHGAQEELDVNPEERRKLEILSQASKNLSVERQGKIIESLTEQLGGPGKVEGFDVWEGMRKQLAGDGWRELANTIQIVNGETESNSVLSRVTNLIDGSITRERKELNDNRHGRMAEATTAKPSSLLLERINEDGAELTGNDLGEVEDALHILTSHGINEFFQSQNIRDLEVAIDLQEQLVRVNEEFDPVRSGFFQVRNVLEQAAAAIQLDFKSKPNYVYAHPEYSERMSELNRLQSKLQGIEAVKFLQYRDIDLDAEAGNEYSEQQKEVMGDLLSVGQQKPLGWLPLDTLQNAEVSPEQLAGELESKGLKTLILDQEEGGVRSGALFVYDESALKSLIEVNLQTIQQAGWPTEPDAFVRNLKNQEKRFTPMFNVIADAFNDKANKGRL